MSEPEASGGHSWLRPSLPKMTLPTSATHFIQDLAFVSFSLYTLAHHSSTWRIAANQQSHSWFQSRLGRGANLLISKLSSFQIWKKKVPRIQLQFAYGSQKSFTKHHWPSKCSKMHWPSVMKGSVHQAVLHLKFAKGRVFWSVCFVAYLWHPSQTKWDSAAKVGGQKRIYSPHTDLVELRGQFEKVSGHARRIWHQSAALPLRKLQKCKHEALWQTET